MKHPIASVISYCSNDARFIQSVIAEAKKFSQEIYITVCDHLFNGEKEDFSHIENLSQLFPECRWIYYPYLPSLIPKRYLKKVKEDYFWHTISRWIALEEIDSSIEYLLFLDADEVVDGKRLTSWLDSFSYKNYAALRFSSYWYFRKENFQANTWEDSSLLVKKKALSLRKILGKEEREGIWKRVKGEKKKNVLGLDGKPLVHHYSWVRSEEEMKRKVSAWGHKKDRNWEELIEKEFRKEFSGTDFVHGYSFSSTFPFASLEPPKFPEKKNSPPSTSVFSLSQKEFLRRIGAIPKWKSFFVA